MDFQRTRQVYSKWMLTGKPATPTFTAPNGFPVERYGFSSNCPPALEVTAPTWFPWPPLQQRWHRNKAHPGGLPHWELIECAIWWFCFDSTQAMCDATDVMSDPCTMRPGQTEAFWEWISSLQLTRQIWLFFRGKLGMLRGRYAVPLLLWGKGIAGENELSTVKH